MVILASGSPRRKELLGAMGIEFEIRTSDVDETPTETEPEAIVKELSKRKGEDVYTSLKNEGKISDSEECLIISADTLVFLGSERLGKPGTSENAAIMLGKLSGKTHQVITGVYLTYVSGNEIKTANFSAKTDVYVAKLSKQEIDEYVSTKEPLDKAGAYAIQGLFAKHIEGINGEYANVVGLPVASLYKELKKIGYIK